MYKYYVTAAPEGLGSDVQQITTVYQTIDKALAFLQTKTEYQRTLLYIRRIGAKGEDAGLELGPEQVKEKLHV